VVFFVQKYTLLEYRNEASIDNILASSRQFPNADHIAVQSRLLYYHPGHDTLNSSNARSRVFPVGRQNFVGNYRLNVLTELALQKCSSVSFVLLAIICLVINTTFIMIININFSFVLYYV